MFTKTINLSFIILPLSMILGNFALNLNILLINSFFIFFVVKNNQWNWCKLSVFKLLILLYLFQIFNSIYNYFHNPAYGYEGLLRSIGFVKFIFFVFSFQYLINKKEQLDKIFKGWIIIISVVIFDVFFESIFGHNIFGFKSKDYTRIISFFYNENVVGAFLLAFSFTVCLFYLNKDLTFKKRLFINIIFFLIPLAILVSGERSNFLKCLILFSLILIFIQSNKLIISKLNISFLITFVLLISIIFVPNIFIKQTEFFFRILKANNTEKFVDKFQNIQYLAHYDTAWNIFKDFPVNGVGSKNFRIECAKEKYFNNNLKFSSRRCSTHPHQIHFELLSEHGIIGYLLFFYLILSFTFNNLRRSNDIFNKGLNFYLLIFLIPILPGGSIFSSFNGSLFWIIFALANYAQKSNQSDKFLDK